MCNQAERRTWGGHSPRLPARGFVRLTPGPKRPIIPELRDVSDTMTFMRPDPHTGFRTGGFRCWLLLVLVGLCSCSRQEPSPGGAFFVGVSIPPYAYLAERIAGERAGVLTLLPAGSTPETFDPRPKELVLLVQARLYFKTAFPWEERLVRKLSAQAKHLQVVDLCEGIKLRPLEGFTHSEAPSGANPDPHVWLDPVVVIKQCHAIAESLCKVDPKGAAFYRKRASELAGELSKLHEALKRYLQPFAGKTVYVVHPALGYFTERYGMKQKAVEQAGKEPTAGQIAELIESLRKQSIAAIISQKQFPLAAARRLAESLRVRLIQVDPLEKDYRHCLWAVARAVAEALGTVGKPREREP